MNWLKDNLVKILGSITTSLSTLLAANAFEGLLSANGIRVVNIINVVVGAALVAVGFNNTTKERVAAAFETAINATTPKQGGFARVRMLITVAAAALVAGCLLTGCATTPVDVIQPACTTESKYQVERCAKAWAETYEVYQKRALELKQNPAAPADVVQAVKDAEALASRAVIELTRSGAEYIRIRDEVAAGQTTEEQLAIATANLDRYIATVSERIDALIRALSGNR